MNSKLVLLSIGFVALICLSQAAPTVKDPVKERAQSNYRAVVEELNNRFANYLPNCFPRPKGCLCVIGEAGDPRDGRKEKTERRKNDADCKSKPGDDGA